jgi:hypothetical protein
MLEKDSPFRYLIVSVGRALEIDSVLFSYFIASIT